MTEAQETFQLATKMYAEATLKHAQQMDDSTADNMAFWQTQLWHAAEWLAAEQPSN